MEARNAWVRAAAWAASVMLVASCGGGGGGEEEDSTAPSTPAGLALSTETPGQVQLQWQASNDGVGVSGYRVYRTAGGGALTLLRSVAGTSTSDTALTAGTSYCYAVSAYDAAGNESARSASQCATVRAPIAFPGFDFGFHQGDFWEYRWDYSFVSVAQGSSPSTTRANGRFWVVLGAPRDIAGVTAYSVEIFGASQKGYEDFAPEWAYLAMANSQLLGSTDGITLKPVFDAAAGKWAGGGFFDPFQADALTSARQGTISGKISYIAGPAIVASRSSNQNECETIAGVLICGDSSYSITANEYYREGVGPVGYYYYHSYMDCGGGFCSGGTWEHELGLTASSFTGQTNPVVRESEPNDSPSTADALPAGRVMAGDAAQSTVANVGNTTVTFFLSGAGTYTATVEDWYAFSLPAQATVTFTLSFDGDTSADLDLFLLDGTGATVIAYSVEENPATKVMSEKITRTLAAGEYRIGVDAYLTPSGARRYLLLVE